MELSPWSIVHQLQVEGIIKPGEKPTLRQFEDMNERLHEANEQQLCETGQPLYTEYWVPQDAKPIVFRPAGELVR